MIFQQKRRYKLMRVAEITSPSTSYAHLKYMNKRNMIFRKRYFQFLTLYRLQVYK